MSRGGRLSIAQRQRMGAAIARRAVDELAADCSAAASFFLESIDEFLVGPIRDSELRYQELVRQRGAEEIALQLDDLVAESEDLRNLMVSVSVERDVALPSILIEKPAIVSAGALQVQRELSELLQQKSVSEDGLSDRLIQLADRMQADQEATREALDMAALVAGAQLQELEPLTTDLSALVRGSDERVREQLQGLAETAARGLAEETHQVWAESMAAVAGIALEDMEFESQFNPEQRVLSAIDKLDESKSIEVRFEAQEGQLTYELAGYEGTSCEAVEKQFLSNLSDLLGITISDANRVSWSTGPRQRHSQETHEKNAGIPGPSAVRSPGQRHSQKEKA